MNFLLWNILLALTWMLARGDFSLGGMLIGLLLGWLALWLARRALPPSPYFTKVPQLLAFGVFYIWQLILSNFRVAYDVVTPTHYMRPGLIAVPLAAKTDLEITVLAHLISLTPGSLSVDLSPDRSTLYVHVMYIDNDDVELARRRIKDGLERRVLEVLR